MPAASRVSDKTQWALSRCRDNAHIRRYFVRAGDAHPQLRAWAQAWVERIGALYGAHTAMATTEADSSAHRYAAAQFSAALAGIDAERKAQAALPCLHPAAAKVLATC